jgi:hypothetical protein
MVPSPPLKPSPRGFPKLVYLALFLCVWLGICFPCHPQSSIPVSAKKLQPPEDLALQAREDLVRQLEKVQKDRTFLDQVRELLEFLFEKPTPQVSRPLATMGDANKPEAISCLLPNRSKILTTKPSFYWQQVAWAKGYRVQLFKMANGQDRLLWGVNTSKSPLTFPQGRTPLEPCQQYVWRVQVQGTPEKRPIAKAEFWLPSEKEMEVAKNKATTLEKKLRTSLPEAKVLIVLSGFYSQRGFHFKALQLLEQAHRAIPNDPLIKVALARVKETMNCFEGNH